jgi:hypothetical protein
MGMDYGRGVSLSAPKIILIIKHKSYGEMDKINGKRK